MSALFTLSASVALIVDILDAEKSIKIQRKMLSAELDLNDFAKHAVNEKGEIAVDKLTFVLRILEKLEIIDFDKQARPWIKKFEDYDKDGSGILDENDLLLMKQE